MEYRQESRVYSGSDTDVHVNTHQRSAESDDNLIQIEETIKNVSRNMRKGDWTYLCRHPEVRAIIRVITTEAIKKHPKNIYKFAADLFNCNNQKRICKKINKQLKWIHAQVKSGTWTPADGALHFPESSSSSFDLKKTACEQPKNDEEIVLDEMYLKTHMCPDHFKPSC
ncbi:hypothetical protein KR215_008264 [Drosophila sulfurigaster]|nr:hypothetical protein KR215_008264 [Drosophila sulfurigaster]